MYEFSNVEWAERLWKERVYGLRVKNVSEKTDLSKLNTMSFKFLMLWNLIYCTTEAQELVAQRNFTGPTIKFPIFICMVLPFHELQKWQKNLTAY